MKTLLCLLLISVILVPTWFTGIDHPWAAWLALNRELFYLHDIHGAHFHIQPVLSDSPERG